MSLFLDAIAKKPVSRPPIWIMRQAGRYLPEYRALREKHGGFMAMCTNPEIACEITLQPIQRFGFDAAIIFSDILTIPDAMGLGLHFVPGQGPQFERRLDSVASINALGVPDPEECLSYVMDAIRLTKRSLSIPLLGFSGSPWTLAAYMVEGRSNKGFPALINLKNQSPNALHHLLNVLSDAVVLYLKAQVAAGADALMVFDTWGGMLANGEYQTFSLAYLEKIVQSLKADKNTANTPIILFTKGGGAWLEAMTATGCDALGIDWSCDLAEARSRVGGLVALQGNMNPEILRQDDASIVSAANKILAVYGQENKGHAVPSEYDSGYIFNLGHGITPDIAPEKVQLLVETVKNYGQS